MAGKVGRPRGVVSVPEDQQRRVVDLLVQGRKVNEVAAETGLHHEVVRRIMRSPDGAFRLEDKLREAARERLVRLSTLIDKTLSQIEDCLQHGQETLNHRSGEIVRVKPPVRDLVAVINWLHHSSDRWAELLAVGQVVELPTADDTQHNIARLEELLAAERRRLASQQQQPQEPPQLPAPEEDRHDAEDRSDWLD